MKELLINDNKKENIFHDIFLFHNDVMLLINPETGLIIEANLSAERFYGYPRNTFINMNFTNLQALSADDKSSTKENSLKLPATVLESQHRLASGEVRTVEIHLTSIKQHKAATLFCVIQDITERKHVTAELCKLSQAVEQSPAAIAIANLDGNLEYINPSFCKLTGYASNELLGKNPRILKSGLTSADEYACLWKTITAGGTWQGVFCNKKKNGEFYWERARIAPIKNNAGSISHFVAIKEDITEQKQAENSLQKANLLLKKTIASLNEAVFIVDTKTRQIQDVNICAEQMFGYGRAELIGKHTRMLHLSDEMWHSFGDKMLHSYQEKGHFQTTYKMKRKDGSVFPSEHYVSPIIDENGNYQCHVCVVRDNTERIQTEGALVTALRALSERKTFVECILANLHSGIIVTDLKFQITMANPYAQDLFLMPVEKIIGMRLPDICPKIFAQISAGVHSSEIVVNLHERDLTIGFTRLDLNNADKKTVGHIINFRDLSEIVKIRSMIQQKDRLSTMGEVLAGVAHEMRNPLFGMTTVGQILQMELNLSPQHQQLMDSFMKESRRLNNLLQDLLDGTRELKLAKKTVRLSSVIEAAIQVCTKPLLEKNITLSWNPDDSEPLLQADPEKLEQVVVNLIQNAIDASDPGSGIEIVMEMDTKRIFLKVIDSGHGIPEIILPKIFDVFFTSKKGGTGMGLYISKNIAMAHGGSLSAENNARKGAQFLLQLPRYGDQS